MTSIDLQSRFRGCLLGLAVGDAVGTTVEFKPRGSFAPLTDMVGGGPFRLSPGEWTDDTSMALCLAASLVERQAFDADDQMRRYTNWRNHGYMSSNGVCFDIGGTVATALSTYARTGDPFSGSTDPTSAGNGSIMRLAPIPMFGYPDHADAVRLAGESSRTTHGAAECVDACRLLASMLFGALEGRSKRAILDGPHDVDRRSPKILLIAQGSYQHKTEAQIRGSGYVVDSLEAALWSFFQTESYEEAILTAANLGDDADTTAAVCGQLAGAYYGVEGIPSRWLERLAMRTTIEELADALLAARASSAL